jgi:phosphate:Na+ symporter
MWIAIFLLCIALAGFLCGLLAMRAGLEQLAAGRLPEWLNRFVKSPWRGLLTGTVATALLQSSSAVTIIAIGLVSAGTLSFENSIGIVLGSNIGTTATTQIIALRLDVLIAPLILLGALLYLFGPRRLKNAALALLGFGMVFFALRLMTLALNPLGQQAWFQRLLLLSSETPPLGVLAGTVLTALVQSSSATTALTIALATQGLIDLPGAISVVFGNNIGSCFPSVLAAMGAPTAAKRVAAAHVLLNVFGVLGFMPFLPLFSALVRLITGDPAIQVAMAHSLFNIICSLAVLPVVPQFARLVTTLVPSRSR